MLSPDYKQRLTDREMQLRAFFEMLEKLPEAKSRLKAIRDIKQIQEIAPSYEHKALTIASGLYGKINCHGAALYFAGALTEPKQVIYSDLDSYLPTKNPGLKVGSLVFARAFGKTPNHSGVLLTLDGSNSLIIHKGGFDNPIEVIKLTDVFPTNLRNIESYSF